MNTWHDSDNTFHEIYSGSVIVDGEYLGQLTYDSGRADLRWHRGSHAYFCPECGEVWSRLVMADSAGRPRTFEVHSVACAGHRDFWNVPGSLLAGYLEHLLDSLPPAAVVREFHLHLVFAERESGL